MRVARDMISFVLMLGVVVVGPLLMQGCEGCNTRALRRYGSTCGSDSECAGGVCFRGKCTKSCKDDTECAGGICIAQVCQSETDDYDGDGLTNGDELSMGTNPQKKDSDGDGIPDKAEVGVVSSPTDTNNDGIIDAMQSNKGDKDGDCMVDAYDIDPKDPSKSGLPDPKLYCNSGVCADHLADVKITCNKKAPTYTQVVLGCAGCQCTLDPAKVPDWQGAEQFCDNIDNDCDGLTDEDLRFDEKVLGQACVGIYGICAQTDANGKLPEGIVECGTDKQITCSVHGNGSQSIAKIERCNGLDDDCDNQSDEDFTWTPAAGAKALAVGASCASCGEKPQLCPGGKPANAAVVTCSGDTTAATCSALPYAPGFVEQNPGRPQPRLNWSVALSQSERRVYVYGGAAPTADGMTARAELWTLDVQPSQPARWQHLRDQAPGAVDGGALVMDGEAKRLLLLGGKINGKATDAVWQRDAAGVWSQPADIPALPAKAKGAGLQGVVVGAQAQRRLVLFTPGSTSPIHWITLGGNGAPGSWQAASPPSAPAGFAKLDGRPSCLVPTVGNSPYALALTRAGVGAASAVVRVRATSIGISLAVVSASGPAPTRHGPVCALGANNSLLVFGGHEDDLPSSKGATRATFGGSVETAASLTWAADNGHALAQLSRSGAWSGLLHSDDTVVVLGGYNRTGGGTQKWHRRTTEGPLALTAKKGALLDPIDARSPQPRVGAASGHSAAHGLCVAGGLGFELPDEGQLSPRVLPMVDAWCANADGAWTRIADGLPPFAFGMHGVDPVSQELIMVGGLALTANVAVKQAGLLWRGGLNFAKNSTNNLPPKVTDKMMRLALKDGKIKLLNAKGPFLAGSASVIDKVRRRLISFGGFDNKPVPVDDLWVLDLATDTWQNVSKDYPEKANRPLRGYGQLAMYLPAIDALMIAGGVNYQGLVDKAGQRIPDAYGLAYQNVEGAKLAVPTDHCIGPDASLIWRVPTLTTPLFGFYTVPTFADIDGTNAPTKPLFRLHYGRPAFTPVLFDTAGQRGLLAVQKVPAYEDGDPKTPPCPSSATPSFTDASVAIRLNLGTCDGSPKAFLASGELSTLPDAFSLAVGRYDDTARRSWVWSGLDASGRPGSGLWSLDQTCKQSLP